MLRHIKPALDVVSTLAVIVAAGVFLWRTYNPPIPPPPPGRPPLVEVVTGLKIPPGSVRHVRGNGPVALVAFSDYQCPFCARHVQQTGPAIKDKLLESGDIREVYLNFPLAMHPKAPKAGEAAECAAKQGRFWDMHEAIFAEATALEIADFTRHAERLKFDLQTFSKCLESGETADVVQKDLAEGKRLAVSATPAFFVGLVGADGAIELRKRINGAAPFEEFEKVVKELRPSQGRPATADRDSEPLARRLLPSFAGLGTWLL